MVISQPDNILIIDKISKRFDGVRAVNDLSWDLEAGHIYGLLGQNGAGKTTTIRMILAIIFPDTGAIHVFGKPLSEKLQYLFGYLPEERGLYRKMRVDALLSFFGKIRGLSGREAKRRSRYWLERLGLENRAQSRVEELSRGMQQKIQFIVSILHSPSLLILDEPFQGMDPVNADLFKDIMLEMKQKGTTVLLSTHIMEHAEKLCDRICLIHKGEKILEGNISSIKREWGRNTVTIGYEGSGEYFYNLPEVVTHNDFGSSIELELKPEVDPAYVLEQAVQHVRITHFNIKSPSLHEIFIKRVSEEADGDH